MRVGGFAPLIEGARALGIDLGAEQLDLFDRFRRELLDWNTRVNLTSIVDPGLVLTRHFLDALTVVAALSPQERERPLRVIDVGAGAGLPGLALQIALPRWRVTELDSVAKKTRFVSHIVDVLGLAGTGVLTGRAEDLGRDPDHRESYDLCLARGVAPLRVLAEYTLPFCRVGGCLIAMKKGEIGLELAEGRRAAGQLGARVGRVVPVPPLPDLGEDRLLVRCDKIRPTRPDLPRAAGILARRPL